MTEKTKERIRVCLAQPGMTKKLLAHAAGVHRNTIEDFDKPGWNPQQRTIDAILSAADRLQKALP